MIDKLLFLTFRLYVQKKCLHRLSSFKYVFEICLDVGGVHTETLILGRNFGCEVLVHLKSLADSE